MPAPRKRLGKGLGALLGESAVTATAEAAAEGGVREVPVERIRPNRFQPRNTFDDGAIEELAASIAGQGILQPLLVTPHDDGGWELVSGERRWRAARRAGLARVPVLVREVDARGLLEIALVENLQREDLDPIDEAAGYRRLVDEFELTQAELARAVGKSRPAIANALRLLDLPEKVQAWVREGALSSGHGRALLGLDDAGRIVDLAARAVEGGLSVRQVERLVRREKKAAAAPAAAPDSAHERERERLEEELRRALGTRVTVRASREGKGRIEIAFYDFDDLERLRERLTAVGG